MDAAQLRDKIRLQKYAKYASEGIHSRQTTLDVQNRGINGYTHF